MCVRAVKYWLLREFRGYGEDGNGVWYCVVWERVVLQMADGQWLEDGLVVSCCALLGPGGKRISSVRYRVCVERSGRNVERYGRG